MGRILGFMGFSSKKFVEAPQSGCNIPVSVFADLKRLYLSSLEQTHSTARIGNNPAEHVLFDFKCLYARR
jgi:hypothetical protein